jgi:nucleoside-diphosphate-sugar epimerase
VVAGEDPEMQFLHIDDYCDAVEAALEARTAGTFNVAGRGTLRVREMTGMLGSRPVPVPRTVLRSVIHWTWRLRLQNRSTEAGLDLITHPWLVSTAAARKGLGWEARHTSREAIAAWAEARRGRRRPWQTERL